jgi:hypothetical protein
VGRCCSFHIRAFDYNQNDTLFYSDDSELFDIDPVSGLVSFRPKEDDVGQHIINFTVTDGQGNTDSGEMTLIVKESTPSNFAPRSEEGAPFVPFLLIPVLLFFIITVGIIDYSTKMKSNNKPKKREHIHRIKNVGSRPEFIPENNFERTEVPSYPNSIFYIGYSDFDTLEGNDFQLLSTAWNDYEVRF